MKHSAKLQQNEIQEKQTQIVDQKMTNATLSANLAAET
jgi:hypothetical protein